MAPEITVPAARLDSTSKVNCLEHHPQGKLSNLGGMLRRLLHHGLVFARKRAPSSQGASVRLGTGNIDNKLLLVDQSWFGSEREGFTA